ncbi:DNA photolyase family protein [Brevibacterium casei]|uniref:cryptochrome/photolyase family protein n=1 Tax=Brevibacterium casei TaxID=33889 RepID=UPI00223B7B34|nr:deoxyribodipyrimidine photo-lyase [Brevibacterium casei]MCT2357189.1 DNA photolyase family protein [Brevibacterium casei]
MVSRASRPLTLLWFRDDLRVTDHEALTAARDDGDVVAIWVREERDAEGRGPRPLGAATRWWVHESLQVLGAELDKLGIPLLFAAGTATQIIPEVAADLGADTVRWSRRYAPSSFALDEAVARELDARDIESEGSPGALLVEPWQVEPSSASAYYKVFTPFWNAARQVPVDLPLPVVKAQSLPQDVADRVERVRRENTHLLAEVDDLRLLEAGTGPASTRFSPRSSESGGAADISLGEGDPRFPWWEDTVARHWTPGCVAALEAVDHLGERIAGYAEDRDIPGDPEGTSALSPRLRFGEISARQLLAAVDALGDVGAGDREAWIRQLYWREFAWHLTYHVPDLDWRPMRPEFADFPYEDDPEALAAWQAGRTGIALVDAGMRQLWRTGWMHNRVRMVAASLLTKNLLLPWQVGEQWFWDTLVDADEANNPVSWQWVAGCGADASPFFRVFNPERQRARFDPDGVYVRQWLEGDAGEGAPIVDLGESRQAALAAYDAMKSAQTSD